MLDFRKFNTHRILLICILTFVTVGCDQISKVVVRGSLPTEHRIQYLGNSFVLLHAENAGAFLSLGADLSARLRFWIFSAAVLMVLVWITWYVLKNRQLGFSTTVGLTLVLGGGIGNLIDRLFRGTVTDFLNVGVGSFRTGIFNIADVAIVIGVLFIVVASLRQSPVSS